MFPGEGPFGGKYGADTSANGGNEETENIEVAIYGVITLYERPGRPANQSQATPPEQK
jgi:hypothetical protein